MSDMNYRVNVEANTSPIDRLVQALKRMEKTAASIANTAAEAAESIALVGGAAQATGEATGKSITDMIALDKAMRKAGDSAKNVDFSKFGKDLNFDVITRRLNNLQKRLGKELTPVVNVNNFQQASEEIRRLAAVIDGELKRGLEELKIGDDVITNVDSLRKSLNSLTDDRASRVQGLLDFESFRSESQQIIQSSDEIRKRLRDIGPDAQRGVETAVDEFRQLSQQLRDNEARAKKLGQGLIEAQDEFKEFARNVNQGLTASGIEPIRFEDIFPTAEQQKLNQLQSKLDAAVGQGIQGAAFRDTVSFFTGLNLEVGQLDRNVVGLTSQLPRLRYALYDVSNTAAAFGAAMLGVSAATVKVAADFERAFADVERTVGDGSDASVQALGRIRTELIQLSQELPVSFEDLAGIGTLAGQLNVAESRIADFTSTVAQFTATTDVTLDAAATAFGRLDQLVEGVNGNFEALASSILLVGVNAVATESDIIAISSQISSVANVAGFTADELIGFSSALASVGTRPELARGTFTRLFTEIQQSVGSGGEQLEAFARTANQSVEQFTEAWGAGSGAEQVIAILRGLQAEGSEADRVLAELGITSVRDVPTLLKLAQGVEDVERQLAIAKIGFIENNELTRQYGILSETLTERLAKLNNSFQSVIGTLGEFGAIAAGPVIEALNFILSSFQRIIDNPVGKSIATLSVVLTAVSGVVLLVIAAFARAAAAASGLFTAFNEGRETLLAINVNVERLTASLNGLSGSAAVAGQSLDSLNGSSTAANSSATILAGNLKNADKNARKSAGGLLLLGGGLDDADKNSKKTGISIKNLTGGIKGLGGVIGTVGRTAALFLKFNLIGLGASLALGGVLKLVDGLDLFGDEADDAAKKAEDLEKSMAGFEERFGAASGFIEAVKQDTKDFQDGVDGARVSVEQFDATVEGGVGGLSDYGKVLAVATGNQDLLAYAADSASDSLERQSLVIGRNTEALIRQQLAADLAARATETNLTGPRAVVRAESAVAFERGDRGLDLQVEAFSQQNREDIGLASFFDVITDPELSSSIRETGFDVDALFESISRADTAGAEQQLRTFEETARQLAEELRLVDAVGHAEQIAFLEAAYLLGTDALRGAVEESNVLRESLKGLIFEQIASGEAADFASEEMEQFRDALKSTFDEAYAQINAERALEESIASLGAAFAQNEASIVASGTEIQSVIDDIVDSSANTDESVDGLSSLYTALIDGGYASAQQLSILRDEIIALQQDILATEIAGLEAERAAAGRLSDYQTGGSAGVNRLLIDDAQQIRNYNEQIADAKQRQANLDNSIVQRGGDSAYYANKIAEGYSDVEKATGGSARNAKDLADNSADAADAVEEVEEKVRTLLDYGSDLSSVINRAFDIRFSEQQALDSIADSWQSITERVESARESIEELKETQEGLSSDRSIKEYFLSVAESYGDMLRAAELREELAELDRKQAESARELRQQQLIAGGDLSGDEPASRDSRAALQGLVSEYQDYIVTLAESGASQNELRQATARAREEFIAQARELGFQEEVVLEYAAAFDDVTTAINNVPRDITVDANVDPAIQALNELNAKLQESREEARKLNEELNKSGSGSGSNNNNAPRQIDTGIPAGTPQANPANPRQADGPDSLIIQKAQKVTISNPRQADYYQSGQNFSDGGFTGRGGKFDPAGIVHKGEFVVPKQYVNQSTGLPDPSFLAQLQNGLRGFAQGGFVGATGGGTSDGVMMVELSPYDRKLLSDAGNVQLRLNGRVVAEATNDSNRNQARRGAS